MPSPKSHLKRGLIAFVAAAVKVATLPDCCAVGSTGTVTTSGGAPLTVQVKFTVAALTPSLTAATTL